jgi:pimeloyl-ACP methyl ester carboxylesterase
MKKVFILFLVLFAGISAYAQEITGDWSGILSIGEVRLTVIFHISRNGEGLSATMDSPNQNAFGIPVSSVAFDGKTLKLNVAAARIEYEGRVSNENPASISGDFKQNGMTLPLTLVKSNKAVNSESAGTPSPARPQTPQRPFPYEEEEVYIPNSEAKINLAGTLTIPAGKGPYPAVVLISGSGAQNRDEEIMGHRPFLVLSDFLTRNGVAVLRYDDRGTAKSEGNFNTSTTYDFSTDAEAALNYLLTRKEIDAGRIGLIGESEGGLIAPMVAARNGKVGFIVLMAGPGVRGDEILMRQFEIISLASGMDENMVRTSLVERRKAFDIMLTGATGDEMKASMQKAGIQAELLQMISPWMVYFVRHDPAPVLENVKCPVLALFGSKDMQVPPDVNIPAMRQALARGGNSRATVKELPNLNHLFQECKTGLPSEYYSIEETISPVAMGAVLEWIKRIGK